MVAVTRPLTTSSSSAPHVTESTISTLGWTGSCSRIPSSPAIEPPQRHTWQENLLQCEHARWSLNSQTPRVERRQTPRTELCKSHWHIRQTLSSERCADLLILGDPPERFNGTMRKTVSLFAQPTRLMAKKQPHRNLLGSRNTVAISQHRHPSTTHDAQRQSMIGEYARAVGQ